MTAATRRIARPPRGALLVVGRAGWIVLFAYTFLLVVLAFPVRLENLSTLASAPTFLGQLTPADLPGLEALGLSLRFYGTFLTLLEGAAAISFLIITAVIFLRRSLSAEALFFSMALLPWGAISSPYLDALAQSRPGFEFLVVALRTVGLAGIVLFLSLFPNGRFVPAWLRRTSFVWVLYLTVSILVPDMRLKASLVLENPTDRAIGLVAIAFVVLLTVAQIYRYRSVSTSIQRQQTKWVVYGLGIAVGVIAAFGFGNLLLRAGAEPGPLDLAFKMLAFTAILFSEVLIAASIAVAILRYRLYDIDVLIRRTLIYGLLSATLAGVYLGLVFLLQTAFTAASGQRSSLAVVFSTLVLAASFTPMRARIQTAIDRRFYRRRYDAERTLLSFNARLRQEMDPSALIQELCSVVDRTFKPEHLSLWLNEESPSSRLPPQDAQAP